MLVYSTCEAGICQTICKLYTGSVVQDPEHCSPELLIFYGDLCCLIASWELRQHITWLIFQTIIVLFPSTSSSYLSYQSPFTFHFLLTSKKHQKWKIWHLNALHRTDTRDLCFCRSEKQPSLLKLFIRLFGNLVFPENFQSLIIILLMRNKKIYCHTLCLGETNSFVKYLFHVRGLVSILWESSSWSKGNANKF